MTQQTQKKDEIKVLSVVLIYVSLWPAPECDSDRQKDFRFQSYLPRIVIWSKSPGLIKDMSKEKTFFSYELTSSIPDKY